MLYLGIIIGLAIAGIAWVLNELRWSWKIGNEMGEYEDPDATLNDRYRIGGKHRV